MSGQFINKRNILIAVIVLLIIIILLLPVNIPFSVKVTGKVVSGQQWLLMRQADGSILSTVYDHSQDVTVNYTAYQVERGDVFQFKMAKKVKNAMPVVAGDTVGYIFSNEFYQELNELEGELSLARAHLDVVSTGEKETIIAEAQDEFLLNQERSIVQNRILERQTKLFRDALVSSEDYEITRGMTRIYELETQVAKTHLQTLQTGEKPEILVQARSQIAVIENELNVLYNLLNEFTVTTPLSGKIYLVSSPDTLLLAVAESRVVLMPIQWQYLTEIDTSLSFKTQVLYNSTEYEGSIVKKSNYMRMIGGQQVFIVTGILKDQHSDLPVNMLVQCSISGMRRTIWDYVKYFLQEMV